MIHPARAMPYKELIEGLRDAVADKLVYERTSGDLRLFNYSPLTVYNGHWTNFTRMARGLIVNERRQDVVATPLQKFFNLGERIDEPPPELPFEAFEKLDGSLIILYHDGDRWRCATRGSFDSEQAKAADEWFCKEAYYETITSLVPGFTYLAEWVGPSNKIVVPYEREELVLLAVYDRDGYEHSYPLVQVTADMLGWRCAARHDFASLADLVARAAELPSTDEGFVLRYQNGFRLKVKGDQYRRVHVLISRCTPLAVWEAMAAGDNLDMMRRELPEEFWDDFDGIHTALKDRLAILTNRVGMASDECRHLSDKELGLHLNTFPEDVRRFLFPARRYGDLMSGKTREAVFRAIRPSANVLPGYAPSYAMNRVLQDDA